MAPQIYSVGHSRHALTEFVGLLRQHEIAVLVDVRSRPASRFSPQFNRRTLEQSLRSEGVRYVFEGERLGGRPKDPGLYDSEGHALYWRMAEKADFRSALHVLDEAATGGIRQALMCAEEDPVYCHRLLLIGRVLASHGLDIEHIRGDGHLQRQSELDAVSRAALPGFSFPPLWRSVKPIKRTGSPE